jgi:hypothetical protein
MFCCHVAQAEKPGGVGLNDAALGLQTGSACTLSPPCLVSYECNWFLWSWKEGVNNTVQPHVGGILKRPEWQNEASHYITEHIAKLLPPLAFKPVLRTRSLLFAWLAECNWFLWSWKEGVNITVQPHVGGFCNALHHRTEHHITSQGACLNDDVSETVLYSTENTYLWHCFVL